MGTVRLRGVRKANQERLETGVQTQAFGGKCSARARSRSVIHRTTATARSRVEKMMYENGLQTDLISQSRRVAVMLEEGHLQQVMDESISWLRQRPNDLFAIESLLKAQWRTGDLHGALRWVERAIVLNPLEPGYFFLRGLLRQSVGMISGAADDFETAIRLSKDKELNEKIGAAIHALEAWQMVLLRMLLEEDMTFRIAFTRDAKSAAESRGFRFSNHSILALNAINEESDSANLTVS